jgi:hypothetical protein
MNIQIRINPNKLELFCVEYRRIVIIITLKFYSKTNTDCTVYTEDIFSETMENSSSSYVNHEEESSRVLEKLKMLT